MKKYVTLLCAFLAFSFLSCNDDSGPTSPSATSTDFKGTWTATIELFGSATVLTFDIKDDNTYEYTSETDGNLEEQEVGTWEKNDNELSMTPTTCGSVNFFSDQFESIDCPEPYTITIDISDNSWVLPAGSMGDWEYSKTN
jgi:hypothetical protein